MALSTDLSHRVTIGVVSFAHPHAEAYVHALKSRGLRVIATDPLTGGKPDHGEVRGIELAARLGIEYVDDIDALLDDGPDAVIVTTENALHRSFAEKALRAGVPVLCEKPLTTTIEDAAALIAVASDAGVPLRTAYPVRFAPAFEELVARVRAGELGEIISIHGTNNGKLPAGRSWFTSPALSGGGALVDHVVHCADLIDVLLGEAPSEVFARSNRILHGQSDLEVETGGLVSMVFPSGVIAAIDCSWSQPETAASWGGLTLEVHGTKGSIRINPFAEHVAGFDRVGPVFESVSADLDSRLLDAFLDEIIGGLPGSWPCADAAVGLRTLAVVDAAQRSVTSGRTEAVALEANLSPTSAHNDLEFAANYLA